MANINNASITHIQLQDRTTNPSETPAANHLFFFTKDGVAYLKLEDNSYIELGNTEALTLDDLTDVVVSSPTKGMLLVYNGSNWATLAAGTNGYLLMADSAETTGLKWEANTVDNSEAIALAVLGW